MGDDYDDREPDFENLKKEAQDGDAQAKYRIGMMYKDGNGVERDCREAVKWFEEAANGGFGNAYFTVGVIYYHGEEFENGCNVKKDRAKAFEWFKKGLVMEPEWSKVGDIHSNYYLGLMYLNGDNTERDYETGFSYFERAVNRNSWAALECIDIMFQKGLVANSVYKTGDQWYSATMPDGNAAHQLAHMTITDNLNSDGFGFDDSSVWNRQLVLSLPDCSRIKYWLTDVRDESYEINYRKGIFWFEQAAEKGHKEAYQMLAIFYLMNKKNPEYNRAVPAIARLAGFISRTHKIKEKDINLNREECKALLERILEIAQFINSEEIWSINSILKESDNSILRIGLIMAASASFFDIEFILDVAKFFLKMDENSSGEDQYTAGKRLILEGIESIKFKTDVHCIKIRLTCIIGEDLNILEEEWKQIKGYSKTNIAIIYFERGRIYDNRENWDAAIYDFQTAYSMTEKDSDRKNFRTWLQYAWMEKQKDHDFYERIEPYARLIEKIKSESPKPIYEIVKYETKEEWTELAAAFAVFEEYQLLDRLIRDGAGAKYNAFNFQILNETVRPQLLWWEPAPLYLITIDRVWKKMKDPVKMLEYLVKRGANIDMRAGDGSNPLFNQIHSEGSIEVIKALLNLGADVNCLNPDWDTPLSIARADDLTEIEQLLLEYGALMPEPKPDQEEELGIFADD